MGVILMSIDDYTPDEFKQLSADVEDRRQRELRYTCDRCGFNIGHEAYEDWNQCPKCGNTSFSEVTEGATGGGPTES